MRRLLRSLVMGEELARDTSTLDKPAILEQLNAVCCFVRARHPTKPGAL